eukprot:PhM_4_TR17342/c0_g1_i2/m.41190/K13216/PPP1R8, NIPP1; nuclear inhibitor of protein phosphatase 1
MHFPQAPPTQLPTPQQQQQQQRNESRRAGGTAVVAKRRIEDDSDWDNFKHSEYYLQRQKQLEEQKKMKAVSSAADGSAADGGGDMSVAAMTPEEKRAKQGKVFTPPPWCATPSGALHGIHIEVRRKGQTFGRCMIDKLPYYIFGRNANICDVALHHESNSNAHVAVVHHKAGGVYVVDLKSSHGTFLGEGAMRKKLEPAKAVRWPEGVPLTLGFSSRVYYLKTTAPIRRVRVSAEVQQSVDDFLKSLDAAESGETQPSDEKQNEQQPHSAEDVKAATMPMNEKGTEGEPKEQAEQEEEISTAQVRHILIKHINADKPVCRGVKITRSPEEAVTLAESVRHHILKEAATSTMSTAFTRFAGQYSECVSGKKGGGALPPLKMVPVEDANPKLCWLIEAVRILEVGEVSPVVESFMGYHIVLREA